MNLISVDEHEKKEVLQVLRFGFVHQYQFHSRGAEIESEVLKRFPKKDQSQSTLAFHIHRKALIKKYLERIDNEEKKFSPPSHLKISSSIDREGHKTDAKSA